MASKADEVKHDTLEWEGQAIAYSWCHSRRRTLGITVRPDKSVSVRVPLRTALKDVRGFVSSRAEWILKVWKRLKARPAKQLQEYGRGTVFMYQGEALRLELTKGLHRSLQRHDGLLILTTQDVPSEEVICKMINSWYRKQAVEIIAGRSIICHNMMHAEGIPLPPITIRSMTTRWGSYSYQTRRITLNLNLIKSPPACLDYVIIHELCHIKVQHHGPDFWLMVSRYCPDYLSERRRLKQYV